MPTDIGFPEVESGPDRQTRIIGGTGGPTLAFTLAPGLFQYVESVRAVIDNTAGAEARPEIEIATADGAVIANKRQGETIPAGGTGSATWALRLDDERAPASAVPVTFGALVQRRNAQSIPTGTSTAVEFDNVVWDTAGMTSATPFTTLTITEDGLYLPVGLYNFQMAAADNYMSRAILTPTGAGPTLPVQVGYRVVGNAVVTMINMFAFSLPMMLPAGSSLDLLVRHEAVAARNVFVNLGVVRIGTFVP